MDETLRWYLVRTPVGWRLCGCSSHRDHYCIVSETVKDMFHSVHTTKHQAMWNFSSCGATARIWPRPPPLKFLYHSSMTHKHTRTRAHTYTHKPGRTPLNEWSALRKDRYIHNTQQTQQTNIYSLAGIRSYDTGNQVDAHPWLRQKIYRDGRDKLYLFIYLPRALSTYSL